MAQPPEQGAGRHQTQPGCRQLQGEGQPVEPHTDRREVAGVVGGQRKVRIMGLGASKQQGEGGLLGQLIERREAREIRHG